MAIRELKFRQNDLGECIDYIVFEFNGMGGTSQKICRAVTGDEDKLDLHNYFEAPNGIMKIFIHIDDREPGLDEIEMKLTVTAFQGNISSTVIVLKIHKRDRFQQTALERINFVARKINVFRTACITT